MMSSQENHIINRFGTFLNPLDGGNWQPDMDGITSRGTVSFFIIEKNES
jgi:hypothetical protein